MMETITNKETSHGREAPKTTKARSIRKTATRPTPAVETKTSKNAVVITTLRHANGSAQNGDG